MRKPIKYRMYFIGILCLVALFLIYRAHTRTITGGAFFGLTVTVSTKADVIDLIRTKERPIVTKAPKSFLKVTHANLEDLELLERFEGINLSNMEGPGPRLRVFFEGGTIVYKTVFGGKDLLPAITKGSSVLNLKNSIREVLKSNSRLVLSSQTLGYGLEMNQYSVNVISPEFMDSEEQLEWLLEAEAWMYRPIGGYKTYHLYFDGDVLAEIRYKNYFIELP